MADKLTLDDLLTLPMSLDEILGKVASSAPAPRLVLTDGGIYIEYPPRSVPLHLPPV